MELTRQAAVATAWAGVAHAPMNAFSHMRTLPDATFTDVASPNLDTLYSTAWLDLNDQPMVLRVPVMGHRYYLMQLLDAWTNVFANPGTRTTGPDGGQFVIFGPHWRGPLPSELIELPAPTNLVWLLGRTQTNGRSDCVAVHEIQDKYLLTPLSNWPTPYQTAVTAPTGSLRAAMTPVERVATMDAHAFFGCLNTLMESNPPSAADARAVERFSQLGVLPGAPLFDNDVYPALGAGISTGRTRIMEHARGPLGTVINGWEFLPRTVGRYGTNYLLRAVIARMNLGANLPEDAVYAHAVEDVSGKPLHGQHRYAITFPNGGAPPVRAFWSITMYNASQGFVTNPIDRYVVGDRDDLVKGADGTLTLYVQHESPGAGREPNWLPAPADSFNLAMRLYWPAKRVLDGSWLPPAIQRVG
jgi:hypothetical protein